MFRYSIFETALGHMGIVVSQNGLHMVVMPKKSAAEVKKALEEHYTDELTRDEKGLARISSKLREYLKGKRVVFKEKFDVDGITPFEMKVWDIVFGIPYGEVRSYAW
ncbi:MAG: hypothetical protein PHH60_06235, partial [Candidatus Margulisbacteria bacterium]|nr:hypothetical protein [Candidatus Margulisiibacteriota bacterium]